MTNCVPLDSGRIHRLCPAVANIGETFIVACNLVRHSREGGDPVSFMVRHRIRAFAGTTIRAAQLSPKLPTAE